MTLSQSRISRQTPSVSGSEKTLRQQSIRTSPAQPVQRIDMPAGTSEPLDTGLVGKDEQPVEHAIHLDVSASRGPDDDCAGTRG